MDDTAAADGLGGCPHVNRNDARCGSRFSLGRIDQAFCVCFGAYHACPMYHRINTEVSPRRRPTTRGAIIDVTFNGHAVELRPTGS